MCLLEHETKECYFRRMNSKQQDIYIKHIIAQAHIERSKFFWSSLNLLRVSILGLF